MPQALDLAHKVKEVGGPSEQLQWHSDLPKGRNEKVEEFSYIRLPAHLDSEVKTAECFQ
jgi:hypothetical protein